MTDGFLGQHIRGYEITALLGEGGYGAVYRAFQHVVSRDVAVKVILPSQALKPDSKARFESEARLIGQLEHPHIVPLYDYWQDDHGAFLVMRLMQGGSLRQQLRQGTEFPLSTIMRIYDQIGAALKVAHDARVIHRDIKPDNILLDQYENAYLSDFGIAKNLNLDLSLTNPDEKLGTESYAAPEQFQNRAITTKTDIFTLGIMLYELLTGSRPFISSAMIFVEPMPSVLEIDPAFPPALDRVIATAAAIEPAERYPDVMAMVEALRAVLAPVATPMLPVESPLKSIEPIRQVFIAYAEEDQDFVQRLIYDLGSEGISVWVDKQGFKPGTRDWETAVRVALRSAYALILVASPVARQSSHVSDALAIAENNQCPIYPVWIAGETWSESVSEQYVGKPYIRLRRENYTTALHELVTNVGLPKAQSITLDDLIITPPVANFVPRNPYKALRAFRQADQQDFFGRTHLVNELLDALNTYMQAPMSRLLPVIGASGSGKSSVVMAGLLPALQKGRLPQSGQWQYLPPFVPGTQPLENMMLALGAALPDQSQSTLMQDLKDTSTRALHTRARQIVGQRSSQVVMVIDQFEELFAPSIHEDERQQFINLLLTAVSEPGGPLVVVLTMRADFYDRPMNYPELGKLIEMNGKLVLPMSLSDLFDVVQKPAVLPDVQLTFEKDLVADIVFEVRGQDGALPLLQFTLDQLYEHRNGRALTREAYTALGGVRGALAQQAEAIFNGLPTDGHRRLIQSLFLRLIEPGMTERDTTRRRASLRELQLPDAVETSILEQAVHAFIEGRLLTTNHLANEDTIEVSHEALITAWERLASWIRAARDDVKLQRLLSVSVAEWIRGGRRADDLSRGARLIEAQAWAERNVPTAEERAFIDASIAEAERAAEAERLRQAKELALAQEAAKAARQSFNRLRLLGVTVLGAVVIILLVGSILLQNANSERERADANAVLSNANVTRAVEAQATANRNADEGRSLALATLAQQIYADGNPFLSLALALRANQLPNPSALAQRTLAEIAYSSGARQRLLGHEAAVTSVVFSSDGQFAASSAADGTLMLWDLTTSEVVRHFSGHTGSVNRVTFSPDNQQLLSGGSDTQVILWDVARGEAIRRFEGHSGAVQSVAFSPNGELVVSGGMPNELILWEVASGQILHQLQGHSAAVKSAAFSSNGRTILSASFDGRLILWDVNTGEQIRSFEGHSNGVTSVAFSPDGGQAISGSLDRSVILWDVNTGAIIQRYQGHSDVVTTVAFAPDGTTLLSGSRDASVILWDTGSTEAIQTFRGHGGEVTSVAYAPIMNGHLNTFISASIDRSLILWDLKPGAELDVFDGHEDRMTDAEFSPDEQWVVSASADATILFHNLQTGMTGRRLIGHEGGVQTIQFSTDGTRLLSGGTDGRMILWDVASGQEIHPFEGHEGSVNSVAFSADGTMALSGSTDTRMILWDIASGEEIRRFEGHPSSINAIAFSPNGQVAVSGGADRLVILWDIASGQEIHRFEGHRDEITGIAFHPNGQSVLSGSSDDILILWDINTYEPICRFQGHTGGVTDVAFSTDGQFVISSAIDGNVIVWESASCQEIRRFQGHRDQVTSVAFSTNGREAVSTSNDDRIILWRIDGQQALIDWIYANRVVVEFSDSEREVYPVEPFTTATPEVVVPPEPPDV